MTATLLESNSAVEADDEYPVPPRGEDLPCEDGEPLETPWHRFGMNVLLETLEVHFRDRNDYFAGGNMFVHFSTKRVFNKDFRGPDFFVVLGVEREPMRRSWVTWEENGRYPDVVVELISDSTAEIDSVVKKQLFQDTWKTSEYFCYDPEGPRILGWRLINARYVPIEPDSNGRLHSERLGISLGSWQGEYIRRWGLWPCWFDGEGRPVPTFAMIEKQQTALEKSKGEMERKRAEAEKQLAEAAEAELAKLKLELSKLKGE